MAFCGNSLPIVPVVSGLFFVCFVFQGHSRQGLSATSEGGKGSVDGFKSETC